MILASLLGDHDLEEVSRHGHIVLTDHLIFDVGLAIGLFSWQIERASAYPDVVVLADHASHVLFQLGPFVPVEAGANLWSYVGEHECLVHERLRQTMIGRCCHVTTVVSAAFVVAVCCPEILMEIRVLLEFAFSTISLLCRSLKLKP